MGFAQLILCISSFDRTRRTASYRTAALSLALLVVHFSASGQLWTNEVKSAALRTRIAEISDAYQNDLSLTALRSKVNGLEKGALLAAEPDTAQLLAHLFFARSFSEFGDDGFPFSRAQLTIASHLAERQSIPNDFRAALLIEQAVLSVRDDRTPKEVLVQRMKRVSEVAVPDLLRGLKLLDRRMETVTDLAEAAIDHDEFSIAEAFRSQVRATCTGPTSLDCAARASVLKSRIQLAEGDAAAVKTLEGAFALLDESQTRSTADTPSFRVRIPLTLARKARSKGLYIVANEMIRIARQQTDVLEARTLSQDHANRLAELENATALTALASGDRTLALSLYEKAFHFAQRVSSIDEMVEAATSAATLQLEKGASEQFDSWASELLKIVARNQGKKNKRLETSIDRLQQIRLALTGTNVPILRDPSGMGRGQISAYRQGEDSEKWLETIRSYPPLQQINAIREAQKLRASLLFSVRQSRLEQELDLLSDAIKTLELPLAASLDEKASNKDDHQLRCIAFAQLGGNYLAKQEYKLAESAFAKALSEQKCLSEPHRIRALHEQAVSQARLGHNAEALATAKLLIPTSQTSRNSAASALLFSHARVAISGHSQESLTLLEQALDAFAKPKTVEDRYFDAVAIVSKARYLAASAPIMGNPPPTQDQLESNYLLAYAVQQTLREIASIRKSTCAPDLTNSFSSLLALSQARWSSDSSWRRSSTSDDMARSKIAAEEYDATAQLAVLAFRAGNERLSAMLYARLQQVHKDAVSLIPKPALEKSPLLDVLSRLRAIQIEQRLTKAQPDEIRAILSSDWATVSPADELGLTTFYGVGSVIDDSAKEVWHLPAVPNPEWKKNIPADTVEFVEASIFSGTSSCAAEPARASIAFVVKDHRLVEVVVGRSLASLTGDLTTFVKAISLREDASEMGKALYRDLLEQPMKHFAASSIVWVVANGGFHQFPFSLIHSFGFPSGTRSVAVATDASLYSRLFSSRMSNQVGAVFANPDFGEPEPGGKQFNLLPASQTEGEYVSRALGARLFAGSEASVMNLIELSQPKVLHFATHSYTEVSRGIVDSAASLSFLTGAGVPAPIFPAVVAVVGARLALANANQATSGVANAGQLTGFALSGMNLKGTRLVVFSSCNSSIANLSLGATATAGLSLSAHIAGAKTVLSTLWRVDDDASALFMRHFYSTLISGSTPVDALSTAQQELRKYPRYAAPYFWGAYVVSGTNESVSDRQTEEQN